MNFLNDSPNGDWKRFRMLCHRASADVRRTYANIQHPKGHKARKKRERMNRKAGRQ